MHRPHINPRGWLRRPDREFWLDLLRPPPQPTEAVNSRRQRLTRYALGGGVLISVMYASLSTISLPASWPVFWVNVAAVACFGCGMWAASLGAHRAARMWLMTTLLFLVSALFFLPGTQLLSNIFMLLVALFGRILFTPAEPLGRFAFAGVPMLLLLFSVTGSRNGLIDLSMLSPQMMVAVHVFNNLIAALCVLLLFNVFEREVLLSESGLVIERARSERLLHAVLPRRIADELREGERMIANHHPEVTVLFADVAGFTPWAAQHEPELVVSVLENIFHRFDLRVAAIGAEKIKTIGDAYMVISGAPDPRNDHAHVMARLALQLLEEVCLMRKETSIPLDLRIGLHTGPVIAGVIGAMRFSYDVWGDTVNTASRMESHGEPGRIQLSAETRAAIENNFDMAARGSIEVKGKGPMETWWLLGERTGAS